MTDDCETCVERIQNDKYTNIYTSERKFINELNTLKNQYPNDVIIKHINNDGSIYAKVPYNWFRFVRPPMKRNYTEEQRKTIGERTKKNRENKKGIKKIMDDIKRALLGDHEAVKRLTDAGVLLPCPHCNGRGKVSFKDHKFVGQNFYGDKKLVYRVQVICNKCRSRGKPVFTEPLINPNPYITKWGNCYKNTDICNEETNKFSEYVKSAIQEWNTRAPILSAEELQRLEVQL